MHATHRHRRSNTSFTSAAFLTNEEDHNTFRALAQLFIDDPETREAAVGPSKPSKPKRAASVAISTSFEKLDMSSSTPFPSPTAMGPAPPDFPFKMPMAPTPPQQKKQPNKPPVMSKYWSRNHVHPAALTRTAAGRGHSRAMSFDVSYPYYDVFAANDLRDGEVEI
jgi:hypothetical protein